MAELQPNIVFNGRHFVRHLGICNPSCIKLLEIMYGVIPRNVEQRLYVKPFSRGPQTRHTHIDTQTHTHTLTQTHTQTQRHDYSIRRYAISCISPNKFLTYHDMGTPVLQEMCDAIGACRTA